LSSFFGVCFAFDSCLSETVVVVVGIRTVGEAVVVFVAVA
jgi:hypothetical protein